MVGVKVTMPEENLDNFDKIDYFKTYIDNFKLFPGKIITLTK